MPWSRCLSALTCKNNYGTCFRVCGFWMGFTNATLKTDIAMCLLYLSKRETSDANKANIQKENDMRLNPPTFIFFLCFFASRKLFVPIFVPPNKMYGMHNERTRNVFMICEILIRLQSADRLARSVNLHTLFNNSSHIKSLSNLSLSLTRDPSYCIRLTIFLSFLTFVDARNFRCSYKLLRTGNVYDFGKLTKA